MAIGLISARPRFDVTAFFLYIYAQIMPNPVADRSAEFVSALEHFENELKGLRTGRASASMVELVPVEAYGSMMELKGVASISIPDPKTIQIEAWDKNLTKDIEKALVIADLGMQPTVAGTVIRMSMPPMTEENRKRIVKQAQELAEQTRITVRSVRESIRDAIQKLEADKAIGEDERFRMTEELDKKVKEWNAKIEEIVKKKEEEIMTI
jgi:ribosome recycling factor